MRGADADGFRITPAMLQTPRFAVLTACDLGGLVNLWASAWAGGGLLPADDLSLAALSRLGPAWAGSGLRAKLRLFFDDKDGQLAAADLAPQIAKKAAVSASRQAAGIASGEARRTLVEHVLNKCSTRVPDRPAWGPERVPADAPRRARKPRASVQLAQGSGSSGGSPAGAENCTANPESEPPRAPCKVDPCISLNPLSSPLEGVQGEEAVQLDLFGEPVAAAAPAARPVKSAAGKPRPTSADRAAAAAVGDLYVEMVRPAYPRTAQAEKNVVTLITRGYTAEQFVASVKNYAAWCDLLGKEGKFRKKPSNYFGVTDDAEFKDFITASPGSGAAGRSDGDSGGRARVRGNLESYAGVAQRIRTDEEAPAQLPPAAPAAGPADGVPEHPRNPFLVA